jgi:hypothetical protein
MNRIESALRFSIVRILSSCQDYDLRFLAQRRKDAKRTKPQRTQRTRRQARE